MIGTRIGSELRIIRRQCATPCVLLKNLGL